MGRGEGVDEADGGERDKGGDGVKGASWVVFGDGGAWGFDVDLLVRLKLV